MNIRAAIQMVDDGDLSGLPHVYHLWDKGLDYFLDPDIPFDDSLDEVLCNMSARSEEIITPKIRSWLVRCLEMAESALEEKSNESWRDKRGYRKWKDCMLVK